MQTTSMLLSSSGRLVGSAWMKRPGTAQFEVSRRTQFQLRFGGTAHDHRGAILGILHPVGPQTVADAEELLAAVLGELQQLRDPAAMFGVPLIFDVEKPLQGVGLRLPGQGGPKRGGPKRFEIIEPLGEFVWIVRASCKWLRAALDR